MLRHLALLASDDCSWVSWNDQIFRAAQVQSALCKSGRTAVCEARCQLLRLQKDVLALGHLPQNCIDSTGIHCLTLRQK